MQRTWISAGPCVAFAVIMAGMLESMSGYLQVTTVADSADTAASLARSAVAARLAASAQVVGPVTSVFWHLNELGESQEWKVEFKTTLATYEALQRHLLSEHPWENPEITAVEITKGTDRYFDWLDRTIGHQG